MTVLNPPGWLENAGATHTAAQLRTYTGALVAGTAGSGIKPRSGVHPAQGGEMAVTQTGSPSMAIQVASGVAAISGTESGTQGVYFVANDNTVTVAVTTAHGSLPRIDIVQARVRDSFYSGATNDAVIDVKAGTPAAGPVAPTPDANAIVLAQILVGAAVSSITNGNITDKRPFMAATGGVLPILLEAAPPANSELNEGQLMWSMDTDKLRLYDGTTTNTIWDKNVQGKGIGSRITKFKSADEQVVNSTAMQNDDHFFWLIEANATYTLQMTMFIVGADGVNVGELGVQWTKPTLCRLDYGVMSPSWQTASGVIGSTNFQSINNDTATTSGQVLHGTSTGIQMAIMNGFVRVGANAGTLQLQWAQWSANGTPTKLLSGSWGVLERVA